MRIKKLLILLSILYVGQGSAFISELCSFFKQKRDSNYPKEYCINLMWINKKLKQPQASIFPNYSFSSYKKTICEWHRLNPGAKINIWYDSLMITQEAVKNTIGLIGKVSDLISLKDIRELKIVKKNAQVFSDDIPVYFRADILRIIIAKNLLKENTNLYFVYSDLDIKPLSKKDLFDRVTLKELDRYSIIMAHEYNLMNFENGFFIANYNKNLIKSMSLYLKVNIKIANQALSHTTRNKALALISECGFANLDILFSYKHYLDGHGKIILDSQQEYDINRDGLDPLVSGSVLASKFKFVSDCKTVNKSNFVSTKKINIPPCGKKYGIQAPGIEEIRNMLNKKHKLKLADCDDSNYCFSSNSTRFVHIEN